MPTPLFDSVDFSNLDDWKTFDEVEQLFPHIKKTTLRWLIRSKKNDGLERIVKRIGKYNYIHLPGFSIWMSQP